MEFKYNAEGIRTQKIKKVNGTVTETTDYILKGKTVAAMKKNTDTYYFTYDASGKPITVSFNGANYTYVKNLQGDIVGILDASGNMVVEYMYDAWGDAVSIYSASTTIDPLAFDNPFRYRGYVWDEETGLYYLRSRYYNSEWGRFLNADALLSTGNIISSVYCYCINHPTDRIDNGGTSSIAIAGSWLLAAGAWQVATATLEVGIHLLGIVGVLGTVTWGIDEISKASPDTKAEAKTDVIVVPQPNPTPTVTPKPTSTPVPTPTPPHQEYFPLNPFSFTPRGLIMNPYPVGSTDPLVLKWTVPATKIAIFEWDYDLINGSHYHVMIPSMKNAHLEGKHYAPGDRVPEPWNSIFLVIKTIYHG